MKILQILPTLNPNAGGVASAVLGLSHGLVRLGQEIEVVVLDDPAAPWFAHADLDIHALGSGVSNYCYSRRLMPWLREHGARFDRVIVNGVWQYPSFATWRRFHRSNVPYFVFPHGMLDPWFKRTYPLKHLKKWCYWPWAEYRVLRDAQAVIFTSEQERIEARESFWLYRCREAISPLGVETPPPISSSIKEVFFAKYPQTRNQRMLLFLGRLHPKKGCDIAIEALARVSKSQDLVLVLAGPDQIGWRQQLQALAEQLGIGPRVIFTGMLEGELKRGALANADALLLPSHQENFGMAVVDALAVGLPVLISNRINIWREIEADQAGYVGNDDIAGTTSLIERWIETPIERRDAMRDHAVQCFAHRFEINLAAKSLLKILSTRPNHD